MAGIDGTWVNSYGSKMKLSTSGSLVDGIYSSTTGSSGSYNIHGYVGKSVKVGMGIPLAMGIYWHSTEDSDIPDPSWHWTSSFSGQYFPESAKNPETIEVLNMLNATSKFPGLNEKAPLLWPQTLLFTKVSDEISDIKDLIEQEENFASSEPFLGDGKWVSEDDQHIFLLKKNSLNKGIHGEYYNQKDFTPNSDSHYAQTKGAFDYYSRDLNNPSNVPYQSLYLVSEFYGRVRSFTGGTSYSEPNKMFLFFDDVSSTDIGSRYVGNAINKIILIKQ